MRRLVLTVLVVLALAGCGRRMLIGQFNDTETAVQKRQLTTQVFPAVTTPKLDVLFMIDNSPSMYPMQNSLIEYLPNFMAPLKALPGSVDLHVGIVSSDMGAGRFTNVPGCRVGGDQGMLQNSPRHPTKCGTGVGQGQLTNATDRYLTFAPDPGGGAALTNFVGDLGDAFACYAQLGDQGCGFESQLGSVSQALAGCDTEPTTKIDDGGLPSSSPPRTVGGCTIPENQGFFRNDAYLAIIVLSNEDDSSAPPNTNLWDPSQTDIDSALGPLTSYRQFEFGNRCNGAPPGREPGVLTNCVAGSWDPDTTHQEILPADFASVFRGLKPDDPRMVYVGVITGPPTPVVVGQFSTNGYPVLEPSCTVGGPVADIDAGVVDGGVDDANGAGPSPGEYPGTASATPGIHFASLVSFFDSDRATFASICAPTMQQPLDQIAAGLSRAVGAQCVSPALKDSDLATDGLQPSCVVTDRTVATAGGAAVETTIPPCTPVICDPAAAPGGDCRCQTHAIPAGAPGCWYLSPDADRCAPVPTWQPATAVNRVGSGYQLTIDRGTTAACTAPAPPASTEVLVDCTRCAADPTVGYYDCSPGCAANWPACCPTPTSGCLIGTAEPGLDAGVADAP